MIFPKLQDIGNSLLTVLILSTTVIIHVGATKNSELINQRDAANGLTTESTVLIIATDVTISRQAASGLRGYGIPYEEAILPKSGLALPALNTSAISGKYGAIVIMKGALYEASTNNWISALSQTQQNDLYSYQIAFGVRMVQIDVWPGPEFGTKIQSTSCCGAGVEQTVSISNSSGFSTAGFKIGAKLSTVGLSHNPAVITDATIATEFATFEPAAGFDTKTTAGVINNIGGRQQMVFFVSFGVEWSETSNYLQHAWIHWATRGLYVGFRRVLLSSQVDDMFLVSSIYPTQSDFRIKTSDLTVIRDWIPSINAKLPPGSSYIMEIAHNGNGNIQGSIAENPQTTKCASPIEYPEQPSIPDLEFIKPIGTGTDIWPEQATTYPYTTECTMGDSLLQWWTNPTNRDVFAHISHTFTHEGENNATYSDINKEISWNKAWLAQNNFTNAKYFSPKGLVPPAITGLHNGDALRAWSDNGITNCVGDNTRPLVNRENEHWPLISNVSHNGFDGIQITPRWATRIYFNCDTADCTVKEWIETSAGKGTITDLLAIERSSTATYLLGLRHDPYMFHQANLRTDVPDTVVNGQPQKLSLIQMWVETVVDEMIKLVNWPIITLKHDDISASFAARMARDKCIPKMSLQIDVTAAITGITITTSGGNVCSAPIPVTVPGAVKDAQGFKTEDRKSVV